MINGVLIERSVKDVMPALKTNSEGLRKVLEELLVQYKKQQEELEKWKVRFVLACKSAAGSYADHGNSGRTISRWCSSRVIACCVREHYGRKTITGGGGVVSMLKNMVLRHSAGVWSQSTKKNRGKCCVICHQLGAEIMRRLNTQFPRYGRVLWIAIGMCLQSSTVTVIRPQVTDPAAFMCCQRILRLRQLELAVMQTPANSN